MTQYIDKSALVAEIENRIKELQNLYKENEEKLDSIQKTAILLCIDECKGVLNILDTLDVKEVDLKKEVDCQMDLLCNLLCYMEELSNGDFEGVYPFPVNVNEDLQRFAKHFYELGLKAKGE